MRSSILKIAVDEDNNIGLSLKGALNMTEVIAGIDLIKFMMLQKLSMKNALIGDDTHNIDSNGMKLQ